MTGPKHVPSRHSQSRSVQKGLLFLLLLLLLLFLLLLLLNVEMKNREQIFPTGFNKNNTVFLPI